MKLMDDVSNCWANTTHPRADARIREALAAAHREGINAGLELAKTKIRQLRQDLLYYVGLSLVIGFVLGTVAMSMFCGGL